MASFNQKKDLNIFLEKPKIKNYGFSDQKILNIFSTENLSDLIKSKPKIAENNTNTNQTNFGKIEEDVKEHNNSFIPEEGTKKELNTVQTEETNKSLNINNNKTKKGMNTIIEQKCFRALVTVTDSDKYISNEYEINFNYKQFSKFKFIEKYMNKITFLIKFLNINYEKSLVEFDYDSLNNFNEKAWLFQLEKYNINYNLNSSFKNESLTERPKSETNNIKINIKPKKKKLMDNIIKIKELLKEDEAKKNLNLNNPNRAEFVGDSSKNSLVIEIKEPVIILKYLELSYHK